MMKTKVSQVLLCLLCAVAMLMCTVPAAVYAKMGCDLPWTKEPTLLEQIIQRDGLLDGVWYPWINGSECGHNLTGNDVMAKYVGSSWARVELDYYGADKVYREIYNLKAMGFNMLAWGGSIYGEGVKYDDYGDVIGIKEDYLANARRLLDMCREIGMPVMWNVYFHSSSAPNYYGMKCWNVVSRMLGDRNVADHYAQRFVKPLCEMLAEYTDVVALVSIADEPENEINDSGMGNHADGSRAMYGVNRDDMIYFMKGINDMVRQVLPDMPRTVASNYMNKTTYRDFELDLMGHNRYDSNANINTVKSFFSDADIILTEYNIGGDAQISDAQFAERLIEFRQKFIAQGYKGGFQWCWMPNGTNSAYYMLNSRNNTDFKETVSLLRYYMNDYRAAYRGEDAIVLDTPVLYANDGTGLVEWLTPRPDDKTGYDKQKVTIERSDDGGKTWKTILKDSSIAQYIVEGKGSYKDEDGSKPKSGFCYRVTVTDGKNTVTSQPNNKAGSDTVYKQTYQRPVINYPTGTDRVTASINKQQNANDLSKLVSFGVVTNRPYRTTDNLIKNGSFEKTDGQWNNANFLTYAEVVTDKTAPDGKKALCFDTTGKDAGWYTFEISGLQPYELDEEGNIVYQLDENGEIKKDSQGNPIPLPVSYTFSTWIKGSYLSKTNAGDASIGVIDPDTGKFMIFWEYYRDRPRTSRDNQQIYPTAWDDEWHLRSVQFTTTSETATIAIYGGGSKIWLDDIALYQSSNGVAYRSDSENSYLSFNYDNEHTTCADSKSLTQNIHFDNNNSTFWQTGDGWRNGTLSIVDNKYEYGKSLKYTGNDNSVGTYYIKWITVRPNTDYVFSFNMKILKSGLGGVALVEDKYTMPVENFYLQLDQEMYSDEWKTISLAFNTSGYTSLGIALCDMGGEALLDNIRLFKASDGKEVVDPFVDASGNTVTQPVSTIQPTITTTTTKKPTTTSATIITLPDETTETTVGTVTTTSKPTSVKTTVGTVTTTSKLVTTTKNPVDGGVDTTQTDSTTSTIPEDTTTETGDTTTEIEDTTTTGDSTTEVGDTTTVAPPTTQPEDAPTDSQGGDKDTKPSSPILLIVIIGAIVLAGGAVAAVLLLRKHKAAAPVAETPIEETPAEDTPNE